MSDESNNSAPESSPSPLDSLWTDDSAQTQIANIFKQRQSADQVPVDAPKDEVDGEADFVQENVEQGKVELDQKRERDEFASKFAALSRKEKKIREREQEMKSRLERLEQLEQLESQITENPLKYLGEKGIDFDKLTQMQLNEGNPTTEMLMERRIAEIEKNYSSKIEELENRYISDQEKAAQQQYESEIESFVGEIDEFVGTNGTEYELIKSQNAVQLVYDVIESNYHNTSITDEEGNILEPGKVLSIKEAADAVEQHLESEAQRLFGLKKFEKLRGSQQPQEPKEQVPPKEPKQTLTNSQSADVRDRADRKLTDYESKNRAAQMLRWD